jgi:hypothetical protein
VNSTPLRVIEMRRNQRDWVRVANPHRQGHPNDARYATLATLSDRAPAYVWGSAVTVTFLVAAGLIGLSVGSFLAGVIGLGAGGALGVAASVALRRALSVAVEEQELLTAELGPRHISRGDLIDPGLSVDAERAVRAAHTVLGSVSLDHGSLGDWESVTRDINEALWQVLRDAVRLDRQITAIRHTTAHLNALKVSPNTVASEHRSVLAAIESERTAIHVAVQEQCTLAERVAELDQRILTPAARNAVTSLNTPTGVDDGGLPPEVTVGSRIDAAHQVLDLGGATPLGLPPHRSTGA